MVNYDKNINNIELKDINNLITEKVPEDKFLEENPIRQWRKIKS